MDMSVTMRYLVENTIEWTIVSFIIILAISGRLYLARHHIPKSRRRKWDEAGFDERAS